MTKTELIDAIASESGLTKVDAKRALEALLRVTTESLTRGDSVNIVGFGAFKVSSRKERTGMNPKTHERIQIPSSRVVRFQPGAELKRAVEGDRARSTVLRDGLAATGSPASSPNGL